MNPRGSIPHFAPPRDFKTMGRYSDTRSVGRSRLAPFKQGETPGDRHQRRMSVAMEHKDSLERWCESRGIKLKITNEDHHWRMTLGKGKRRRIAEWWPSRAKLVLGHKYAQSIHVHDIHQVKEILTRKWAI